MRRSPPDPEFFRRARTSEQKLPNEMLRRREAHPSLLRAGESPVAERSSSQGHKNFGIVGGRLLPLIQEICSAHCESSRRLTATVCPGARRFKPQPLPLAVFGSLECVTLRKGACSMVIHVRWITRSRFQTCYGRLLNVAQCVVSLLVFNCIKVNGAAKRFSFFAATLKTLMGSGSLRTFLYTLGCWHSRYCRISLTCSRFMHFLGCSQRLASLSAHRDIHIVFPTVTYFAERNTRQDSIQNETSCFASLREVGSPW